MSSLIGDPQYGGFRPLRGADVDSYLTQQRQKSEPNYLSDLAPAIAAVKKAEPRARFMCIRVGCTFANGVQSYFLTKNSADDHARQRRHTVVPISPQRGNLA